ncbi:MAG: bifunctional riboflavin kinase/FAD synthetase [Clostridia bacterium]|nr:bifunctional riboflavin kinase/FAD synthetase [Clostridia bacterium]
MKIYYSNEKIEQPFPAIALGNFDGIHLGHLEVIKNARITGKSFGVLLFRHHSQSGIKVITTLEEKLRILSSLGIHFAYVVDFDEEFKSMSCAEFCQYLNRIGVKAVSVGYDYRCGRGASANAEELKTGLDKFSIDTAITEAVYVGNNAVKSSFIRDLITEGYIETANKLMTRPMRISGTVVKGLQNGRKLGFPTANIKICDEQLLPKDGVYCCICKYLDITSAAVLNIGKNPTFNAEKRTVEVHILDYDGELYGKKIDVDIYKRIRGEIKFDTIDELSKQIMLDREYVISWRDGK